MIELSLSSKLVITVLKYMSVVADASVLKNRARLVKQEKQSNDVDDF